MANLGQGCSAQRPVWLALVLVVGIGFLAGCKENVSQRQTLLGLQLGAPAGTAGQLTVSFPESYFARLDLNAAGAGSCLPDRGVGTCTPTLATAGDGTMRLDLAITSREVRTSFPVTRQGIAFATPIDLQARFEGYRPAWSDCRRTAYSSDMVWSNNFQSDLVNRETIACDPLVLRPADPGTAQLDIEQVVSQRPVTRQSLVLASNGDYPLDVVLRTRLRGVTGWTRVDAGCPLPGWNGQPALALSDRFESAQLNRYEFMLDRALAPPAALPHIEVLVRPVGVGQFGLVDLVAQVETLGDTGSSARRTTLRVPAGQQQALADGRYYRAFGLPYDLSASVRVLDDVLDAPDLGTCVADAIRVLAVRTAPRSSLAQVGEAIDIDVQFSAPVTATTLSLLLETGASDRSAVLVDGSGTDTLRLRYTVAAGDAAEALDYFSTEALWATATDAIGAEGRSVDLSLPPLGGAASLSAAALRVGSP